jgi:hypothetical protein
MVVLAEEVGEDAILVLQAAIVPNRGVGDGREPTGGEGDGG